MHGVHMRFFQRITMAFGTFVTSDSVLCAARWDRTKVDGAKKEPVHFKSKSNIVIVTTRTVATAPRRCRTVAIYGSFQLPY